MVKLVAFYRKPEDEGAFERHYRDVHTPLVEKMPGLLKLEVTRFTGGPQGDSPYYLMAEMYFEDTNALNRSMSSPEGKAAAKDLMQFAGSIVTMAFGETE